MFTLAFMFYMFFILCYTALAVALVFHVRTYAFPEDPTHSFVTPFIAISLILISISAYLFSRVPWDSIFL